MLRKSEAKCSSMVNDVINSSEVGIFVLDSNFKVVWINRKMEVFFGLRESEVVGKDKRELIRKRIKQVFEQPEKFAKTVFSTYDNNTYIDKFECHVLAEGKRKERWLEHSSNPIRSGFYAGGRVELYVDIAERKRAEKELRETMEIKSEFTSMVSHQLRTPLTAIKEGIGIVLDGEAGVINEEQKDFLDIAKRNVDRLARVINDILDFQKLDAGRAVFNMQENDMNKVVKQIQQAMTPLVKEKGLNLITELDENLPMVRFDEDKIVQVLMNIVNNAIKFTEKGSITVTTNKEDNAIHVAVQDTGVGIKGEDMTRLFHKFEQLAQGKGKRTGGTGLGLAISKEIMEKHRGKIWAESELGKGTTFHFTLPIKEQRE